MKTIINTSYKDKEVAINQLVDDFFLKGKLIVQGSRNTIKSNFLDDENVNIKYFKKPGLLKSIIYSCFRNSKAKRSFEYANYLLKFNINTPYPIAYIENRNQFGLLKDSYYLCKEINYDFTIRELIHDPLFDERQIILEQFTEFTFKMHEANVNFLDHSPGNTLIVKKDKSIYDFYLIDLNRMKFQKMSIKDRMDNFKKMWLSKLMVKIIANKYADLSNQNEFILQKILLKKATEFKTKITKKKFYKRKLNLKND